MPHVTVKMHTGRPDALKARLAEAITQAVFSTLGVGEESVSVAIEDVAPSDWMQQVYEPEITAKTDLLFKRPGYGPQKA
jgi:4-oxalocrotonate tautomerase